MEWLFSNLSELLATKKFIIHRQSLKWIFHALISMKITCILNFNQVIYIFKSVKVYSEVLRFGKLIIETLRLRFGDLTTNDKPPFAVSSFTLAVCPYLGLKGARLRYFW